MEIQYYRFFRNFCDLNDYFLQVKRRRAEPDEPLQKIIVQITEIPEDLSYQKED